MGIFRIKRFSAGSKVLWAFAPGGYQAKEAGKFAYGSDTDDYRAERKMLALKGAFTPITATVVNQKAQKMAKEGRSQKEIRDYIEGRGKYSNTLRKIAGVGEIASARYMPRPLRYARDAGVMGIGALDKLSHDRAEDLEKKKNKNKKK